jgi:hypothetical protein
MLQVHGMNVICLITGGSYECDETECELLNKVCHEKSSDAIELNIDNVLEV